MYSVAKPSEYLAVTGAGIKDIKLTKEIWIISPRQSITVFDVSPVKHTFEVHAMSAEKLPFLFPAVFTIGPREEDHGSLLKYAKLVIAHRKESNYVDELVQGIIEGETRVLAASMKMEEIFRGTKEFKKEVFDKVQLKLNQFGLLIYKDNVKLPGHKYYPYLGEKVQMEAAMVDNYMLEAKMKCEIGSKLRKGKTQQNAAKIDAETKVIAMQRAGEGDKEGIKVRNAVKFFENQREAELAKKKAAWTKAVQVAEVEAAKAVALREAELQGEVERMNALTTTEKLKAEFLSKARVQYETKVQEANWELYKKQKDAEAALFEKKAEAEAEIALADATFYARKQAAEAELYAKLKEAEGIVAMGNAQGVYLSTILNALGGNYYALGDYLMINGGMYQEIAKINAEANRGIFVLLIIVVALFLFVCWGLFLLKFV